MTVPMGLTQVVFDGKDYDLRQILRDDVLVWLLRCPGCGEWGELDDDQLRARVSVQHECGFHETRDFAAQLPADNERTDG